MGAAPGLATRKDSGRVGFRYPRPNFSTEPALPYFDGCAEVLVGACVTETNLVAQRLAPPGQDPVVTRDVVDLAIAYVLSAVSGGLAVRGWRDGRPAGFSYDVPDNASEEVIAYFEHEIRAVITRWVREVERAAFLHAGMGAQPAVTLHTVDVGLAATANARKAFSLRDWSLPDAGPAGDDGDDEPGAARRRAVWAWALVVTGPSLLALAGFVVQLPPALVAQKWGIVTACGAFATGLVASVGAAWFKRRR